MSLPTAVNVRFDSSVTVLLPIAASVGGSFTGVTETVNVVGVVVVPSPTVNVIVTGPPFWLAAGVTVTVRFAPLPPITTFALGMTVVFDDEPVTVRLPAAVSTSPTVNDSAPVDESSLIVWFATDEIVG